MDQQAMTKKDYKLIANAFREADLRSSSGGIMVQIGINLAWNRIVDNLKENNPNFDEDKFTQERFREI